MSSEGERGRKGAASTAGVVVHKGPWGGWFKNARGIHLLPMCREG